ncbi:unnamed protein product, partial [Iphiclides podalirius]
MLDGPVASTKSHHVRQPSTRNRTKPPMPDRDELENRFIKVLTGLISRRMIGRRGYTKRSQSTHRSRLHSSTPMRLERAATDRWRTQDSPPGEDSEATLWIESACNSMQHVRYDIAA